MAEFVLSSFADEAAESFSEQLRISKKYGIRHIEMRTVDGRNVSALSPAECAELKNALDESGVSVSAIGSPYGKISIHDPFGPHLEAFKRTVECAGVLGARYIRLFSFYIDGGRSPEECEDAVLERLSRFLQNAGGLVCAHENESGIYGDTAPRNKKIADAFGGRMKLVFDPANYIQCGQDALEAYSLLEEHIEYMHVKDAVAESKLVVPAGMGDGHLREILRRFSQKGGRRFLSLEPHLKVFAGFEKLEAAGGTTRFAEFAYKSSEEAYA
ncbi:MAG: sugar phosphate isomerase/epimerase, partial [Clostridiales bacterium]|nr:sugar phosphate isomerase/epimerase [Clostridiales bacterium]